MTELDWTEMAAIPETFFTAYGSLFDCLQIQVRGYLLNSWSNKCIGICSYTISKIIGCTVIGTTRKEERLEFLKEMEQIMQCLMMGHYQSK